MTKTISRWAPLSLALIVLVGTAARQQAAPVVATLNLQVLMEQTPGFQEARAQYEQEMQGFETEMTQLQDSLNAMVAAFEQQQVVLSPTARTERTEDLQQFQRRLQTRAGELQTLSDTRQRELLSPLEDRVQTVIDGIRAERNLAVIFDISQPGNIIAADPALDITILVATRLQGL